MRNSTLNNEPLATILFVSQNARGVETGEVHLIPSQELVNNKVQNIQKLLAKYSLCPPFSSQCFQPDGSNFKGDLEKLNLKKQVEEISFDLMIWASLLNRPELAGIFLKHTKVNWMNLKFEF